jgi:hypothetical protein
MFDKFRVYKGPIKEIFTKFGLPDFARHLKELIRE